ncbi:MAG: hypothetical protein QF570_14155 [Myxococcota bacterium]|jgi:hypothetical protein|nr:hypothetical protein [Myxococcota bacterium]
MQRTEPKVLGAGFAFGLLCLLVPLVAGAAVDPHARALEEAMRLERTMLGWRLAIAVSAWLVVVVAWLRARSDRGALEGRRASVRVGLLLVVAVSSFAVYYDFFRSKPGVGFKDTDVFHYYMGSKYFSEVGHFDLYHCTLMALIESGVESRFDLPRVRDQRTLRFHTPDTALAAARQCRAQFSDARWRDFAHDVAWFNDRFVKQHWHATFFDHGYNPTPIWTAVGGALTSRVAVDDAGFAWLIRADRLLIVAALLAIVWAFGLEVAALAAIVWGTGTHWGYGWIGDSFLRNLWFFGVILGLCLVYRKKDAAGGAVLALPSLLRIFPGIFIAAFGVGTWLRANRVNRDEGARARAVALGVGAVVAGAALLIFAIASSAWGFAAFAEFYEKMSVFTAHESLNKLGLSSLIWRSIMVGTGHLATDAEGTAILTSWSPAWLPFAIRGGQLLFVAPGLYWFWRAAQRLEPHETAALGFALIPLLSDPANYYYCFFVCGALLAARRPELQVALVSACVLWLANALVFYREPVEYLGASVVAVALPLFFLYRLSREESAADAEPSAG